MTFLQELPRAVQNRTTSNNFRNEGLPDQGAIRTSELSTWTRLSVSPQAFHWGTNSVIAGINFSKSFAAISTSQAMPSVTRKKREKRLLLASRPSEFDTKLPREIVTVQTKNSERVRMYKLG